MKGERLRTAVVGVGYVGLATAVGLAEHGRDVVLVERDPDRLAALAEGRIPFHEPGLPEAYAMQHAARGSCRACRSPETALTSSSMSGRRSTTRASFAKVSRRARKTFGAFFTRLGSSTLPDPLHEGAAIAGDGVELLELGQGHLTSFQLKKLVSDMVYATSPLEALVGSLPRTSAQRVDRRVAWFDSRSMEPARDWQ
jgi:NAD(P)-dependent dehydrogenase (short-subunit alcohol dehydrogenase family)